MSYHRYTDNRFGDIYEIYTNDETGEFQSAVRSVDTIGRDPIYYDKLAEIPQPQRNAIENLLWSKIKLEPNG
jgi:hypothetical protein